MAACTVCGGVGSAAGVVCLVCFGTKLKPYWTDGERSIYCADCREVLPELGPVDLVLTDPPYGQGRSDPIRRPVGTMLWDDEPVDSALLSAVIASATHAIVWGGNYFGLPACQRFLIWDKVQPEDFTSAMCEQAWTSLPGPAKLFRLRVVSYKKEHPTQKPVELMHWCLEFVPNAETILDPFMGSGTTLRAAKDLGRKAIGIEIEERYCEIAANRVLQEVGMVMRTKRAARPTPEGWDSSGLGLE